MPSALARPLARLIDELSKLPGVGPKTAQRLAYHILRTPMPDADALAAAIRSVKTDLRYCSVCFNIAEADPCVICSSDERDGGLVCVVEEPLDVLAIERTGQYKGRYHVLHGAISPVNGVRPDDLKIAQLGARRRDRGAHPRDESESGRRGDVDVRRAAVGRERCSGDASGARSSDGRGP